MADRRAGRLEAVPAPREQGKAVSRPGDHAEGAEEAAADPDGRRDAGDPRCLHPAAGPLLLRRPSRDSGCRAGEALGLRHEDIAAAEQEITIEPRENANGARAKSGGRTVPVGPELIRLYADYLHEEYGGTDSDYVFINIWAEPKGHAWSYQAVYDLVLRLRARTGIAFDPHWLRHSAATRWLRDGVPIEVVSTLLGHSSVAVTSSVYGHLTAEDARAALEKAGWFTGKEVSW